MLDREVIAIIFANGIVIVIIGYFIKRMITRFENALNGTGDVARRNALSIVELQAWSKAQNEAMHTMETRHADSVMSMWKAIDAIQQKCWDQLSRGKG